jgi:5-deoxy-glucuronate isomerase
MTPGLITSHREGFPQGFTLITAESAAGADFGLHILGEGETLTQTFEKEEAWLLLEGKARIDWETPGFPQSATVVSRGSLFDEAPTTLHAARGTRVKITAMSARLEWAVCRASNAASFEPRLFAPESVSYEYRGQGLVQGACLRNVRQVFDLKSRPSSKLVLGEVVNFPGRWSSYPPHHHAQPEIYHYRFTLPQGYGHAECGDDVYKVKSGDTLMIPGGRDHSQVSAPGYGMYYLWVVKHLEGNPYLGFEFTDEHRWMLNPEHQGWEPKV